MTKFKNIKISEILQKKQYKLMSQKNWLKKIIINLNEILSACNSSEYCKNKYKDENLVIIPAYVEIVEKQLNDTNTSYSGKKVVGP